MSFILDALRKSELERQRQSGPSIAELPVAREDRRLPVALVAIGVLLAVNVAVVLYFLLRNDTAPVAKTQVASVAAPPAPPATVAVPSAEPLTAPETGAVPAAAPPGPSSAQQAPPAADPTLLPQPSWVAPPDQFPDAAPPAPDALPPTGDAGLAELTVDLHIYSEDPARRAVFINGRRYTEGMTLAEGPMVEEINRDGVVISYHGQRYLLPRN